MPGWPSGPRPIIRWDARALRARGSLTRVGSNPTPGAFLFYMFRKEIDIKLRKCLFSLRQSKLFLSNTKSNFTEKSLYM